MAVNAQITRTLRFFTKENESDNFYTCDICTEEKKPKKLLSGKHKSNLTTHIKLAHKDVYANHVAPQNKLYYAMKRLKKIQNFCEIIAIDGRPFSWLLGTGFMHSQEDDLNELADAGFGIQMDKNFNELKKYIKMTGAKIKEVIKGELKGRFVSLMLDIATRNNNSILGISVQFMKNNEVEIITIGMMTLKKSHTAKYIVDMLMKCLGEYDIKIDHVISITTDNAKNMIAMTQKFDECVHEIVDVSEHDSTGIEIPTFETETLDDSQMESILNAVADIEAINFYMDDADNFDELFQEIIGDVSKATRMVTTVRCGAHTTQLMVRDALKKSGFMKILTLGRFIVKSLRRESYKISAEEGGISYTIPHMSCDTRWDSDYGMVKNLLMSFFYIQSK